MMSFTGGAYLAIDIQGVNVDSQYQQLNVAGQVNLSGVGLLLTGGYTPSPGDQFIIVANDDVDAVTGTMTGLPADTVVSLNGGLVTA